MKIIRRSSEMATIAIPAQEIFENSEKSLGFCTLIEEINLNNLIDIFFRLQQRRSAPRAENSSNFHALG